MTRLSENSAGFHGPEEVRDSPRPPETWRASDETERSLSAAWITDELLERTQRVWSRVYGRPIDEREALILKMRYGLDSRPPRTLREIGKIIGLTRERVRQIENDALRKLQKRWMQMRSPSIKGAVPVRVPPRKPFEIDLIPGGKPLSAQKAKQAIADGVADALRLKRIEGVEVVGTVPDIRPYVRTAAVSVAPMRIARGIQNKVLEAMAMGVPVVTTPAGLEGLSCRPGEEVLVADDAAGLAEVVARVLTQPDLARRLGERGRQYVLRNHSWTRAMQRFEEVLFVPGYFC